MAKKGCVSGSSGIYGIGWIGALVFYLQQAQGFWEVVVSIVKSFFWPGFLVYDLLRFLGQ